MISFVCQSSVIVNWALVIGHCFYALAKKINGERKWENVHVVQERNMMNAVVHTWQVRLMLLPPKP